MSIVWVREVIKGRTGTGSSDGNDYTHHYKVRTDDIEEPIPNIITANDGLQSIPTIGTQHPQDSSVVVKSVKPTVQDEHREVWFVEVNWGKPDDNDAPEDPDDQVASIQFSYVPYQSPMIKSYKSGNHFGDPKKEIENTAGFKFDPPIMKTHNNLLVSITNYYSANRFDPADAYKYIDTVNNSNMTVAGIKVQKHCAKLRKINPKVIDTGWEVVFEIELQNGGWQAKIANMGFKDIHGNQFPTGWERDDKGKAEDLKVTPPFLKTIKYDSSDAHWLIESDGVDNGRWSGLPYVDTKAYPYGTSADGETPASQDNIPTLSTAQKHYLEFNIYFDASWRVFNLPSVNTSSSSNGLSGVGSL